MSSTDLVRLDVDGMERIARHLANSGQFGRSTPEQAFVAVLAGQELGIPPFASITGIHVIQGKPVIGAGLLAAKVKASGRYDYRIKTLTEAECVIAFFEAGDHAGDSAFTMDEARRAGLASKDVWKQYPRNMLFARAMSNGVAWFAPDVTAGRVYVEGEIDEAPAAPPVVPARSDFIDADAVEVETNGHAPVAESEPEPEAAWPMPRPEDVRQTLEGLDAQQKATLKQALTEAHVAFGRTKGELVAAICAHVTLDDWNRVIARIASTTTASATTTDDDAQAEATELFGEAMQQVGAVPAYGNEAAS